MKGVLGEWNRAGYDRLVVQPLTWSGLNIVLYARNVAVKLNLMNSSR